VSLSIIPVFDLLGWCCVHAGADAGVLSGTWALGTTSVGIHEDEVPLAEGEFLLSNNNRNNTA
jgi:hypothetical protein